MRNAVALQHGVTEELLEQVDHYDTSTLPEHQKLALRLADVYLSSPSGMSEELKQALLANFTSAEIVELLLHLIGWTRNKAMVALGLELDEVRHQVY